MLLGRYRRFLQLFNFSITSSPRHPVVSGRAVIAVCPARSMLKDLMFPKLPGNSSRIKQPSRSNRSNAVKLHRLLGRHLSFSQPIKFKFTSLTKCPIEGSTFTRPLQPLRFRSSMHGTPLKSGVVVKNIQSLIFRIFNFSRHYIIMSRYCKILYFILLGKKLKLKLTNLRTLPQY